MPRFLLELEFAGAGFAGTQWQAGGQRTVQDEVMRAVAELDGQRRHVRCASRLDAGVDAERLPADVELVRAWDPCVLALALTDRLPPDLAVRRAAAVADGFDAIRAAVRKSYRYRIVVRPVRPGLDRRCLWLKRMDHPELMQACADQLIGDRDLSGFANLRHDGSDGDDPVRTVESAHWTLQPDAGALVCTFRIVGRGFLYRQVRAFVGAMVAVATGNRTAADFAACVAGGRGAVKLGNVAPAEGLTLEHVAYDPEPAWAAAPEPGPHP